jgi:hypothetical protein
MVASGMLSADAAAAVIAEAATRAGLPRAEAEIANQFRRSAEILPWRTNRRGIAQQLYQARQTYSPCGPAGPIGKASGHDG